MTDAEYFLNVAAKNYESFKRKMQTYCKLTDQEWDEDVLSDTILNAYETITKQGHLADRSEQGAMSYLFKSFVTNIKRDKLYARNKKRDSNSALTEQYEDFLEKNTITPDEKIFSDTKKDFTVLYLLLKAQANFDDESFHLFNLKTLGGLTYKQLQEHTQAKAIRQKVSNVKKWLKANVSKDEIDAEFDKFFTNNMFT